MPDLAADDDDLEVPVPQWKSLQSAGSPPATTATPWPDGVTSTASAPTPVVEPAAGPAVGKAVDPDDEPDEERPRRSYPYTWLQMILLAVVAFVLGFLVWWVAQAAHDRTSALAPAVDHVASADAWTTSPAPH